MILPRNQLPCPIGTHIHNYTAMNARRIFEQTTLQVSFLHHKTQFNYIPLFIIYDIIESSLSTNFSNYLQAVLICKLVRTITLQMNMQNDSKNNYQGKF